MQVEVAKRKPKCSVNDKIDYNQKWTRGLKIDYKQLDNLFSDSKMIRIP
jgi:hypothetical protein